MKPGVPPLDESFIPQKTKEKEPRSKAMRERMQKRREAAPPKKEKKERRGDSR